MKHTIKISIFILTVLLVRTTIGQGVAINTDGSAADASAMLDIKSTDDGILIPRMTQAERNSISSPATGLLIYQSDNTPGYYFYDGSSWKVVGSEALDINSLYDGKTDGNSIFLGNSSGINNNGTDLKNVSTGYQSFYCNTTGSNNTSTGFLTQSLNTTGSNNTALGASVLRYNIVNSSSTGNGYQALCFATNTNSNTATGVNVLYNNTVGSQNTATGYLALFNQISGCYNTATGFKALFNNINGFYNTAFGSNALYSNTSGEANTAIGYNALYSNTNGAYNVASGSNALYSNTSGEANTASGYNTLHNNTTGSWNSALGSYALQYNETGNYNTAMGYESGPPSGYTDLENTTAIGYLASPTVSNYICFGNTSVTWIGGESTWSTYSDSRAKNQIKEDVIGLDFIMKLRPVTWYWDKDKLDAILGVVDSSDYKEKYDIEKIKQSGFLAQEVELAAFETGYDFSGVHAPVNKNTPYSISYAEFVVPLVKALREQQKLSIEQKQKIEKLDESFNNQQELTEAFQEQNILLKRLEKHEGECQ